MPSTRTAALAAVLSSAASVVAAFTSPAVTSSATSKKSTTSIYSTVDPSVVTKKEYQDICGVDFDDRSMQDRLRKTSYLYPKHVEVIEDFEPLVNQMVDDILLETGEKAWQPQDYLPDLAADDWLQQTKDLREAAEGIPDEVFVVLVGDMVTEEALPTYQTLLNTFEGCDDPIGTTDSAWAKWSRGWTSEENRHGDLLNKYLYLTGKTDMRAIEVTIQHLITSGFNPGARKDPYRGFLYTSFQERATKVSHGNVGKVAKDYGAKDLQRICAKIAGDEGRHEKAYQSFCTEILKRDPDGLLMEFGDMMRGQIVMPAELMTDGKDAQLYENFSAVAQRLGVYTAIDYAEIIQHLVDHWKLGELTGLSPEAEKEQEYICRLPTRYKKLAERSMNKKKDDVVELNSFSWIFDRKA
ncbi:acyl-[acyl carrier protein] desaturase [Skeletonema marinoi]|uniref:Acyl-[acyl carrier protein] desaturase n=1 Tax=Skeletonema marinoi TaxID=267567 RepID=A0AAD9D8M0_9STRA|nr:acyl-[acyl carrier protein] desaturase [Skeletonema marinoi]|mmetsp:Transcript_15171/g.30885  ORF Transcript_15171/g.30885 Transcript_15171/m.30885 type:complete len:411 (+) Transcript_15171:131-1363(+)|eukprot:CAMPEP_0113393962 /NCGR_PEP_ID=MMETSP0013_2-20120614/12215_1 /TAXON_ID=2843 ORGANISM="Skeletonema costatum, Strain 1716" /NCGR_SAMPLE_ID=MMETSP0013_2 /ASSEMBLY_ACC=CAM_ASM_000158 /LENGTH=410 /DNA_ID=CAMNT_0000277691 /DNA_START=192 /DNA_END=1424 /DNA_ORIENTATION=+ /assembly_acc=CAM_ASM_000158